MTTGRKRMPDTHRYKEDKTYGRIWVGVGAIVGLYLILGHAIVGKSFLVAPAGYSTPQLAKYWLTVNAMLFFVAMCATLRNLLVFERQWNWQERFVSRGLVVLLFGSILGALPRAFLDTAFVTRGTPFVTLGLLLVIYGAIGSPVRFAEKPDRVPPNTQEDR